MGRPRQRPRLTLSTAAAVFYPLLFFLDERGVLLLLPAVAAHEAGHLAALRCCGARLLEIRLDLPGLCLETTPLTSARQEVLCAMAGPLGGLLWALAAGAMGDVWLCSAGLSALLTAFNLLPALPLDGGRALLALTGRTEVLHLIGILTAGALLLCAWRWRLWPLLVPGFWLLRQNVSAAGCAASAWPAAPAGRPAPGIPPAAGRRRLG